MREMTDSPNAIIVEVLAILLVIVPVLETRDVLVMLIILFYLRALTGKKARIKERRV